MQILFFNCELWLSGEKHGANLQTQVSTLLLHLALGNICCSVAETAMLPVESSINSWRNVPNLMGHRFIFNETQLSFLCTLLLNIMELPRFNNHISFISFIKSKDSIPCFNNTSEGWGGFYPTVPFNFPLSSSAFAALPQKFCDGLF